MGESRDRRYFGRAPGSVYTAVDEHRNDDFRPTFCAHVTTARRGQKSTPGLPATSFVDVVRADPAQRGLLYAGTDLGVFVSFDDGDHWQSLQRNLPPAWVRDLLVHGDDLIVATQGRAIWVLDNVAPLRQASRSGSADTTHTVFSSRAAGRVRASQNGTRRRPPIRRSDRIRRTAQ